MTAILSVEDGSGIADANSPVSIEEADAFYAAQGNFDWDASENKEAALVRGTQFVTTRYAKRWKGKRLKGRAQGIDFPRSGVIDRDGNEVEEDEVPVEYKNACMVAALQASLGNLDITTEEGSFVTKEQLGPLVTEFERIAASGAGVKFPAFLDDILDNLISANDTARFFLRA